MEPEVASRCGVNRRPTDAQAMLSRSSMSRYPRSAAAVLALWTAGALLAGCAGKAPRSAPPPVAVDVATAQRQDIGTYIQLDGQITPLQQSNLSVPQSGTLNAVNVTEGQRVGRGQQLAKIDDSTLRAQL